MFVQRHADAPDHASDKLAARGFGVQDLAGSKASDHSGHFELPEIRVHPHLCKLRAERIHGIALANVLQFV